MNKNIEITKYRSYKDVVRFLLSDEDGNRPRGIIKKLAVSMRCDPSFVSHLLKKDIHFTIEHAVSFGEYFEFSHDQQHYFVALLLHERAGNEKTKLYFKSILKTFRDSPETCPLCVESSISNYEAIMNGEGSSELDFS